MPHPSATLDRDLAQSAPQTPGSPFATPTSAGPPGTSAPEHSVGCPNCGSLESWGRSSWCPECGFYPRLGISIAPAVKLKKEALPAPTSPREIWDRTPVWARILGGGMLAIFVMSVLIRLATPENGVVRGLLAVAQLAMGLGVFLTMHCMACLKASVTTTRLGLSDAWLHPLEVWHPTLEGLPRTARRVWLGAWGLTAAICAIAVIGGIRYAAVLDDWGFRNRVKSEMASRVRVESTERLVGGGALAGNLDEKVQQRAHEETMASAIRTQNGSELEMLSTDCVVVGYNLSSRDGSVSELILAALVDGELKYVGSVRQGIPADIQKELSRRLPELKRDTAFINCPGSGIWVKPVIACKTSFRSWTDDKLLIETKFKELLAEISGVE